MKIICISPCQIKGMGVVKPEQVIDIDEKLIDKRIAAHFRATDDSALTPHCNIAQKSSKTPSDASAEDEAVMVKRMAHLGKTRLVAQLEAIEGVAFDSESSSEDLARALLRARGAIK